MIVYFNALVAIVGLLLFLLANGKTAEVGKIMFWTGLLAFLLGGHPVIQLLR